MRIAMMKLSQDEWVHRLNALARQMDEICEGVHPSVWRELTAELQDKFRRIALMHTEPGIAKGNTE